MAEKQIYTFPDGSILVYYQQNVNNCTDVNVGFRVPLLDIPLGNEIACTYKNLVFYLDKDNNTYRFCKLKPGIVHFAEHMMVSSLPGQNIGEIYSYFTRTNTKYNAGTTQDFVKTDFNTPSKFLEKICDIESQFIYRKEYDKKELENEKKAVIQELQIYKDDEAVSGNDFVSILTDNYSNLKLTEILGIDKLIINTFTDKQLLKFINTYFTKQNLIMTVVSDLPFETIKPIMEKYFVEKAPSILETKVYFTPKKYEFDSDMAFITPDKSQKTASLGFVFKGSHDYETNVLYSNIEDFLLNNFNGRLLKQLRTETGLTYTSSFQNLDLPQMPLKLFSIITTPKNVKQCVDIMTQILSDMITNGITDEEFLGFKEMWENRRERKSAMKFVSAEKLFTKVVNNQPIFVSEVYEKTNNITKEQINNYFREIYGKSKLCLIANGNFEKTDLLPLQNIINKYRPNDKYLNEHYTDHKAINDFEAYCDYCDKNPKEESQIHFVGEEEAKEKVEQKAKEKTKKKEIDNSSKESDGEKK